MARFWKRVGPEGKLEELYVVHSVRSDKDGHDGARARGQRLEPWKLKPVHCVSNMVLEAGGKEAVMKALSEITEDEKKDSALLVVKLAQIFKLTTRRRFTQLTAAWALISGKPGVDVETSVYGGIKCVHGEHIPPLAARFSVFLHAPPHASLRAPLAPRAGTHMRRPEWLRKMLLHPDLPTDTDFLGMRGAAEQECIALSCVAMLTCDKATLNRVCRQVDESLPTGSPSPTHRLSLLPLPKTHPTTDTCRSVVTQARKQLWKSGVVPFLEKLWGLGVVSILQRGRVGHDTSNLSFHAETGGRPAYESNVRYRLSRYILGEKQVHVCMGSYEDIVSKVVAEELPIRTEHVEMVEAFSRLHAAKLVFPIETILHVHGNYPTVARLRRAECMERSVTDPRSPTFTPLFSGLALRRLRAEVDVYTGDLSSPFAKLVATNRKRSRKTNDRVRNVEVGEVRYYAEGFLACKPKPLKLSRFFSEAEPLKRSPFFGEANTLKRSRFF